MSSLFSSHNFAGERKLKLVRSGISIAIAYLQSVSGEMLLLPSVLILLYIEISLSTSADCGFAAIILARATCNDFVVLSPIMTSSKSLGSELLSSVICPTSRHNCIKSVKLIIKHMIGMRMESCVTWNGSYLFCLFFKYTTAINSLVLEIIQNSFI